MLIPIYTTNLFTPFFGGLVLAQNLITIKYDENIFYYKN